MAVLISVGLDDPITLAAQLDRHCDHCAVSVSPEPAVITGKRGFDAAFGLTGTAIIIDRLPDAMGVKSSGALLRLLVNQANHVLYQRLLRALRRQSWTKLRRFYPRQ